MAMGVTVWHPQIDRFVCAGRAQNDLKIDRNVSRKGPRNARNARPEIGARNWGIRQRKGGAAPERLSADPQTAILSRPASRFAGPKLGH